ncbi:HNH endonuclease [Actinomycetospora termitidis]|uniref:HNH endonuclease n=1 Tax=Actinomycetospora termitidis TaxID=3053470 RepID=A0ABT7MG89_9PSEU|nr:HNH endonuclease [Actinomycetospora sp. Odt1-22]MDL5159461.1 HNH endonuclease [Actinomycetospora sp. Odt1-22]
MSFTVTDLPARLVEKITVADGHWLWTGGWVNDAGYPYVRHDGRDQPAYRVTWKLLVGPIPDKTPELDHLCVTPLCVYPGHLEPVTHAENQRRIRERQTSCRRAGHDWTVPRNVRVRPNGKRYCAECDRQAQRAKYAAGRAAGLTAAQARRKLSSAVPA